MLVGVMVGVGTLVGMSVLVGLGGTGVLLAGMGVALGTGVGARPQAASAALAKMLNTKVLILENIMPLVQKVRISLRVAMLAFGMSPRLLVRGPH